MKHAYLILAHHEFEVLTRLIQALDDPRNDIFIHFDAKLDTLPLLTTRYAGLFIVEKRVPVYWGHVHMLHAEYLLMEYAAKTGNYGYYHLLSGVDMPLKTQDFIHRFFEEHQGREFIGFAQEDRTEEILKRARQYHLFSKHFRTEQGFVPLVRTSIRSLYNLFQRKSGLLRNKNSNFRLGPQWVSITGDFVSYLLASKEEILRQYDHTYCSDELFMQTACWNSPFKARIYCIDDEFEGCKRAINWSNGQLLTWENKDYPYLSGSTALFARKFDTKNLDIVERILKDIVQK